jgi:hypothetical protein
VGGVGSALPSLIVPHEGVKEYREQVQHIVILTAELLERCTEVFLQSIEGDAHQRRSQQAYQQEHDQCYITSLLVCT